LAEAPSAGESVLTYSPQSKATTEHLALADEIIAGRNKPVLTCTVEAEGNVEEINNGET
jgi:hypothetical protein